MGKQGVVLIPVRDLLCELTAFEGPGSAAFEVPVSRAWRASYRGPRARRAMHDDDAPGPGPGSSASAEGQKSSGFTRGTLATDFGLERDQRDSMS